MKWSKKDQAKWDRKNRVRSEGHSANYLEMEQDEAWERLRKKLSKPKTLSMLRRMKDR